MSRRFKAAAVTAAISTIALAPSRPAPGDEGRPDIPLRNVRWQALPEAVRTVVVGPDKRIWYLVAEHTWPVEGDLAAVRGSIEGEFGRKSPRLYGARPVLFEPGGRVWFVCSPGQNLLLGYDGKRWIERKITRKSMHFYGNCPGNGRRFRCDYNVAAGGAAFFIDNLGVHCFAGGKWSYQKVISPSRKSGYYPRLLPEADGKGAIAFDPAGARRLWRWRGGRWRPAGTSLQPDPPAGGEHKGQQKWVCKNGGWVQIATGKTLAGRRPAASDIVSAAPAGGGVWLLSRGGRMRLHTQEQGKAAAKARQAFARLVKALGDDSYRVREQATQDMIALGPSISPLVAEALGRTKDLEVKTRLEAVRGALAGAARPGESGVRLGPYRLKGARIVHAGAGGRMYVTAAHIHQDGKDLGAGLVVAAGKDKVRALIGAEFAKPWKLGHIEDSGPVPGPEDGQLWLAGRPARLLDVNRGAFVDAIPSAAFHWIHAVAADGTVFVSRRQAGQNGSRPIMAYRPGAPDDRKLIRADTLRVKKGAPFCIASDGAVWTHAADGRVVRFDGKKWRLSPGRENVNRVDFLIPGRKGAIFAGMDGRAALIAPPQGVFEDASPCKLIAAHRKDVLNCFPPERKSGHWCSSTQLATDKAGNIWLNHSGRLRALVGQTWVDAGASLAAAGAKAMRVGYLGAVGDGSRVYVTDCANTNFLGRVAGGKVLFESAPATCCGYRFYENVRDLEGAYWQPGWSQRPRGKVVRRLTQKGVAGKVFRSGWSRLLDAGGNVWLGDVGDESPATFKIWRAGRIAGSVKIPSPADHTRLVSDRPGSVFAWTPFGLYHLTSRPTGSADFSIKAHYAIAGGIAGSPRVEYSRLGYIVIAASGQLRLLPIPRPAAGREEGRLRRCRARPRVPLDPRRRPRRDRLRQPATGRAERLAPDHGLPPRRPRRAVASGESNTAQERNAMGHSTPGGDAMTPNAPRSTGILLAILLFSAWVGGLRADIAPVWKVDELAAHSDLIVLGRQKAATEIEIEKVLKGKWPGKKIAVPSLTGYGTTLPWGRPAGAKLEAAGRIVAFISLRHHARRIVANGVCREGKLGAHQGVFGYHQPINPGGYMLRPKPDHADLQALLADIEKAIAGIPVRQQALLKKLRAAKDADEFRRALERLGHITRIGDLHVLKAAAAVPQPGDVPPGEVLTLIRDVQEPRAWTLLKDLYQRTRSVRVLIFLGRLGSFESRAYLKDLLWRGKNPGVRLHARYGLEALCLALRAEGKRRESDLVKADIYEAVERKVVPGPRQVILNRIGPPAAATSRPSTRPAVKPLVPATPPRNTER